MSTIRRGALRGAMGAVYGLLNVAAMTAVAAAGVHQGAGPVNELRDYVLLAAPASEAWDAMQSPGESATFQVAAVTLKPDFGQALAIVAIAIQLLDGERPVIANHLCVALQWKRTDVVADPELVNGVPTWRAVATFDMLVDQTS